MRTGRPPRRNELMGGNALRRINEKEVGMRCRTPAAHLGQSLCCHDRRAVQGTKLE